MGLSIAAKARALRPFSSEKLWLGLASRVEGDTIFEIADASYERQRVQFSEPSQSGSLVEVVNSKRVDFAPLDADCRAPVQFWFVVDAKRGGEVQASGELEPIYVDPATGEQFSARGQREKAEANPIAVLSWKRTFPKWLAGQQPWFPEGALRISLDEEGA